jgi:5-methyltetrahydrofolate--homocysteine methyltransferase
VNGKQESLETILPIAKKYGAIVIGLCLDEDGIPETAEGRFQIAKRIIDTAEQFGLSKNDVVIDPLVLTASAQQAQVEVTIETIRLLRASLGVNTVIGLSNVSFGLPNRDLLNGTFLAQAVGAGLTSAILNPVSPFVMSVVRSLQVFTNVDVDAGNYISFEKDSKIELSKGETIVSKNTTNENLSLRELIIQGYKEQTAAKTKILLETEAPLEIVNEEFIPALDVVGKEFEAGTLFLPQLMQSAEAVKNAQAVLKDYFLKQDTVAESQGKILLATVEGDIHDIGKNIVKMLLENYGFDVVDLGKDVSAEKIIEVIRAENIALVGLSALMTTTVQNMKKTITAIREAGLTPKFMVGGAVLNEEYREFVGADYYAKDAMESVAIAQRFFEK